MPDGTQPWRLFIALPLPAEVRSSLWSQLAPYREGHPAARWLISDSWHVTLLFLGSVPVERMADLVKLMDAVAAGAQPFEVAVSGAGGRERGREAVAWLTIREGAGEVIDLARRLVEACPPDIAIAGPPRRTPAAHLTVARKTGREALEDLSSGRWGHPRARWHADRMALVRSHLERPGARYETLHEVTLYAAVQGAG